MIKAEKNMIMSKRLMTMAHSLVYLILVVPDHTTD